MHNSIFHYFTKSLSTKICTCLFGSAVVFSSCSTEAIDTNQINNLKTEQTGRSVVFSSDELGFNTDFNDAEKKDSASTRGVTLTVGDLGNPNIQLTTKDGDTNFRVLLVLYKDGSEPSFCETSLTIIDKIVKLEIGSVVMSYPVTRLKFPTDNLFFSPGPSGMEGNWRLYAFYGYDQWDKDAKKLYYNKNMVVLNRFLSKDEKITLGKDLKIPFTLRESSAKDAPMGAPITISADKNGRWILHVKGTPYFKPEGSLYKMKLKNAMRQANLNNVDLPYPNTSSSAPKFDFQINGINIESTHSSAQGYYDLANNIPAMGSRAGFKWHNAKVLIPKDSERDVTPTEEAEVSARSPYHYVSKFTSPVSFNKDESTGYFYFWLYDPAYDLNSQNNVFDNPDEGLSVRLDIFNKTLNIKQTAPMVYSSRKKHKSGNLYKINRNLGIDLLPNALDWMGNQIDEINGTYYWADFYRQNNTSSENGKPGSGDFFKFQSNSLPDIGNLLKKTFTVKDYYNTNANVYQWYIPDEATVKSVFPFINNNSELAKITTQFNRPANTLVGPLTENVKIGGITYNGVKSYYYRKTKSDPLDRAYQFGDGSDKFKVKNGDYAGTIQRDSRNVYYAIRFAGTPYCTAFMYMEKGKWYNLSINTDPYGYYNASDESKYSKLRVYAKHLGLLYGFQGQYDENKLKDYLINVVSRTEFWGSDVFADDPLPEVTRRMLSPNGAFQDFNGGVGNVGREFNLWLSENNGNSAAIYRIVEADGKDSYWKSANSNSNFLFKTKYKSNVVPWLDPTQFAK